MNTLESRIEKAVEAEAMKTGRMGTEAVNVVLMLTDSEIEEYSNLEFDEHYNTELDGNELLVAYTEEV